MLLIVLLCLFVAVFAVLLCCVCFVGFRFVADVFEFAIILCLFVPLFVCARVFVVRVSLFGLFCFWLVCVCVCVFMFSHVTSFEFVVWHVFLLGSHVVCVLSCLCFDLCVFVPVAVCFYVYKSNYLYVFADFDVRSCFVRFLVCC